MVNPPCLPHLPDLAGIRGQAGQRLLSAKDRLRRRCERTQGKGRPRHDSLRRLDGRSSDSSIPPNESLGGVEANKDNDLYALAIREGV